MSRFFIYGILPPLEFGSRPELSSKELSELFELNLTDQALKKIHILKLWIDISNIYGLVQNSHFDSRGNYSKSTIKSLIANQEDLPSYVLEFFQTYEKEAERKKYFSELIARYFREEKKNATGYLADFLTFEHDLRILFAGFRAKRMVADLAKELQYEDMDDPIVATVLMQKDKSGDFQFPPQYEDLEEALKVAGSNPSKQYEAIARFRFNFYIKYFSNYSFSLQGILAYMIALWILEDFFALKREEGEKFLSNIVEREDVS